MLAHLGDDLRRVVRARPLVSVAVGGDRYSVGYSALGGFGVGHLDANYSTRFPSLWVGRCARGPHSMRGRRLYLVICPFYVRIFRMAFNENFWVVTATSAPVIALANVVAMGDSYKLREFFRSLEGHPNSYVRRIEAQNRRDINVSLIWALINNMAQAYAFITARINIQSRSEFPSDQALTLICECGGLLGVILLSASVSRMGHISESTRDSIRLAGYVQPGTARYANELRTADKNSISMNAKRMATIRHARHPRPYRPSPSNRGGGTRSRHGI